MKRLNLLICILLCCCLLTGILPAASAAAEAVKSYPVTGGCIYFDTATGTVTGCDETVTEAVIPNSIEGCTVKSIGYKAFFSCDALTRVVLPDGITQIDDYAFYHCSKLTDLSVPDSVNSIGDKAFWSCGMTDFTMPACLTEIGDSAFWGCRFMTGLTIPDSVHAIGDAAFANCAALTAVSIPAGLTEIGSDAFYGCGMLTGFSVAPDNPAFTVRDGALLNKAETVLICFPAGSTAAAYTVPSGVATIADSAFYGCTRLTAITLPQGLKKIGNAAFCYCTNLSEVFIPDGVTAIGDFAFSDCVGLTYVALPDSVTQLGDSAFEFCRNLERVSISARLDTIPYHAFYSCENLNALTIPTSIRKIGTEAFWVCPGLQHVYYTGTADAWKQIAIGSVNDDLLSATLHYGTFGPACDSAFTDIYRTGWYFDAVQYVSARGIMNGVGNNAFAPDNTTTRAMVVTTLHRLLDAPAAAGANSFTDVENGRWYTEAIIWAHENGIVNGYGDGRFCPDTPITREQMAAILLRCADYLDRDSGARTDLHGLGYLDADQAHSYAKDALAWAVAADLMKGISHSALDPLGNTTRAQTAALLMRFNENILK